MYQKDFLLRIIEDFVRFLSIILKLKSEKDYKQAYEVIAETTQKLLDADIVQLSENEHNVVAFVQAKEYNLEQIEILAELLKVKAEIHLELNQRFSAINDFEKSIQLYIHCQEHTKNYSVERIAKITEITRFLDNLREMPE